MSAISKVFSTDALNLTQSAAWLKPVNKLRESQKGKKKSEGSVKLERGFVVYGENSGAGRTIGPSDLSWLYLT